MGKRLIQQRRGRGTMVYRSPGFHFKGRAKHPYVGTSGAVVDIIHCGGHSAPLISVAYNNGEKSVTIAPEGIKVGDQISVGNDLPIAQGNVLPLKEIPEGTLIHNIELRPGDGGKIVRSSGTFAKVVAKTDQIIRVLLPSRKEKIFLPDCRASIGIVAGAGRLEKPLLKAGIAFMKARVKNKQYPRVSGVAMNAVDHPFGGSKTSHKGRPTQAPRNAPPGRKVGKIAPRRTGRTKK